MKSNEQLLKENQDPRQSDRTGTSNNQTRMVDVDKYNELLELNKVEKKRANRLEKSEEYWEEGPLKKKKECKEEQYLRQTDEM